MTCEGAHEYVYLNTAHTYTHSLSLSLSRTLSHTHHTAAANNRQLLVLEYTEYAIDEVFESISFLPPSINTTGVCACVLL
jgi:hypothetical protein